MIECVAISNQGAGIRRTGAEIECIVTDCRADDNVSTGILIGHTWEATVAGNDVRRNTGGGLSVAAYGGGTIVGNTATDNGTFGIDVSTRYGDDLGVTGNMSLGNTGPGLQFAGPGGGGDTDISGNDLVGNTGAGLLVDNLVTANSLTISDNLIVDNGQDGLVLSDVQASGGLMVGSNTIAGNDGSGLAFTAVTATQLLNGIVAFNTGAALSGALAAGSVVQCTDIHGNGGGDWTGDLAPWPGSNGNISEDPLFCDPPAGDYALNAASPCTADNSTCGRMGARPAGCGLPSGSWYVATSGDDGNPGTLALPFRTIVHGVTAAAAGDTVNVLDGRYVEHVAITGPLVLRSLSGDTTTCTIEAPPGYRVITVTTATDTVRIDGFELTGGTPSQGDVDGLDLGGGLLAVGTPVVVSNCHIHDNVLPADQSHSAGGGVHVREGSYLRLVRSKVADNWAPRAGGVCIRHDAGADLYGNLIVRNGANLNAGGLWILPDATTAARYLLAGNTVAANSTTGNGSGATFNLLDDLVLQHNIFAHNDCPLAQVQFNGTVVDMDCNLVYWGTPYLADGPYDASGNIHDGPRFCDLWGGDFSLNELSPAAPGGPVCGLIGALGVGCVPVSGVDDPTDGAVPTVFTLGQAYPNPFNPMTTIDYQLPRAVPVWLTIYALDGRRVRVLKAGEVEGPGRGEAVWRGRDDGGRPVAAGLYVYRLRAGDFMATRKVMLLK